MKEKLNKLFQQNIGSAKKARSRLQLVLARERTGLTENQLSDLKDDLYQVISKYFKIDQKALEIDILHEDGQPALLVNTPVNNQPN